MPLCKPGGLDIRPISAAELAPKTPDCGANVLQKLQPTGPTPRHTTQLRRAAGDVGVGVAASDLDGDGVRSADLVIEAVPETLELKRRVYAAS